MTPELKNKVQKILELIDRGATEGEKDAARKALERIVAKHNIDEGALSQIQLDKYRFKYATLLELQLLVRVAKVLADYNGPFTRYTISKDLKGVKEIGVFCTYSDWVTIECAYEYYRRHMKTQWQKIAAAELKKCRKDKTRTKRRKVLQDHFANSYFIKSGLYKEVELITYKPTTLGHVVDRMKMDMNIEGGKFNKQVATHLQLTN